jgi:hypothetical protein
MEPFMAQHPPEVEFSKFAKMEAGSKNWRMRVFRMPVWSSARMAPCTELHKVEMSLK